MSTKSSDRMPLEGPGLERRMFLGTLGLAAGAAVAASLVPLSVAHPAPSGALPVGASASNGPSLADGPAEELWEVDDMWGHRPRYAHPIPYAPVDAAPPLPSLGADAW